MKESTLAAVLDKAQFESTEDGSRSSHHSRVDEEFALLMTTCANVARAVPAQAPASGSTTQTSAQVGVSGPAENWRRVDGAVTGDVSGAVAAPEKTRFVTEIVHRELGPMSVTVERQDGAVRVLFEVADPLARIAVETQRGALLTSLYGAGVTVASVVVTVRSGGTAFAQRSPTSKTKRTTSGDAPDVGGEAPSTLNLIG